MSWVPLLAVAIFNGAFRQLTLVRIFPELVAHLLSTLMLVSLILFLGNSLVRWVHVARLGHATLVGAIWLTLTVAFEFLAGHYLSGKSWTVLLADYNIFEGRAWILIPIAMFWTPFLGLERRRPRAIKHETSAIAPVGDMLANGVRKVRLELRSRALRKEFVPFYNAFRGDQRRR